MGSKNSIKTVLVTGASGFVGRYLVKYLISDHHVIAFARRTQKDVGLESHPNLEWVLVDITDPDLLREAFHTANTTTPLDFIFHLAAYYDFGRQVYSEIYEKTNIEATHNLLDLAKQADIKRFIFTSSLVASNFPEPGDKADESSPPDAEYPYAITKRRGEELVQEYSQYFPCSIVRLAAVYSDWCEYEPLYHFLKIWLSQRWDAHILPGKGLMAIPYIHVCCIIPLFGQIIKKTSDLKAFDIFLASSDRPVSLLELFEYATHQYFGQEKSPLFIPRIIARSGVIFRNIWGRLMGKPPFEQAWMLDYVDQVFPTDSAYTRRVLDWQPKSRHHISRRLLHLIENLKARPEEWHQKNIDRLHRFSRSRPSFALAEEMIKMQAYFVERIYDEIRLEKYAKTMKYYQSLSEDDLKWYISVVYNNLLTSVRHGDRSIMISFAHDLSTKRMHKGTRIDELCRTLNIIRDIITKGLNDNPKLSNMQLIIYDYIALAIQLAIDEVKDVYENVPL